MLLYFPINWCKTVVKVTVAYKYWLFKPAVISNNSIFETKLRRKMIAAEYKITTYNYNIPFDLFFLYDHDSYNSFYYLCFCKN